MIKNNSGFKPIIIPKACKILVYVDSLEEKKTSGGVIIPEKASEAECYSKTVGQIVEVAFENEKMAEYYSSIIKIGDVVSFRPYAGIHKHGDDDNGYRLIAGDEVQDLYVGKGNEHKGLNKLYLSQIETGK